MNSIHLIDCTLREGKQSLQKELTEYQVLTIAENIVSLGIDQLEIGHAAISEDEIKKLKTVKRSFPGIPILTHSRAIVSDVQKAIEANVDWIGIFISTNKYAAYRINNFSIQKIVDRVLQSIEFAKENGLNVRFTLEDSSRTDLELMLTIYGHAIRAGADRICFADTLGILEPKETAETVRSIKQMYKTTSLEVHFHDDRGLAMANALEAIDCGSEWISTSVNGIGERAGITDTCLLLANLHVRKARPLLQPCRIKDVSKVVAEQTGYPVDAHRPVIGAKAFLHVADLHVKAIEKNMNTYNWIDPGILGIATQRFKKPKNPIIDPTV